MFTDVQTDCFLSLTNTLNFSETAKQLFMTQQAVSKNISKLEAKLGFPLFIRSPHNVQLTEWGKAFLEINLDYQNKLNRIHESYAAERATVRIATLSQPDFEPVKHIHDYVIPGEANPVNIDITYTNPAQQASMLINKQVDMVVTLDRFMDGFSDIETFPIINLEVALMISKDHPLVLQGVDYTELGKLPFIAGIVGANIFETNNHIVRDLERFHLEPQTLIMARSQEEAIKMVVEGKGYVLGTNISNLEDNEHLTCVSTGFSNYVVCAWNKHNCKSYSEDLAKHIKQSFEYARSETTFLNI